MAAPTAAPPCPLCLSLATAHAALLRSSCSQQILFATPHTAPLPQDIDSLTANFQQLKDAQARFAESANSLLALPTDGVARDVMVPLTASLYVPGKLGSLDEVLVDIGTGYYVGKTAPAAAEMLNRKAAVVKGNAEQLMKVRRGVEGWCFRCGLHVDACASESARARGQGSVPAGSFAARAHAPSRTPCTDPGTTPRDIAEHGRRAREPHGHGAEGREWRRGAGGGIGRGSSCTQ